VDQAARIWADETVKKHRDLIRIGYFGSYASGDWGVGSDLDLVLVVESSNFPMERRGLLFDTSKIPVPCDVLVYTREEWSRLMRGKGRFAEMLKNVAVWVYEQEMGSSS